MPAIYRTVRLTTYGLAATMLTSLLVMTAGMLLHTRGERLLSVESASMVPTFWPGDALVVAPASISNLRVGEVVSYRSADNPRLVVSNRLVQVDVQHGLLTTTGDARRTSDPAFPAAALVGRVVATSPHAGFALDALRKPALTALVVGLPAATIPYGEITRLTNHFSRPAYSARGYRLL